MNPLREKTETILKSLRGQARGFGPEMECYLDYHGLRFVLLAQWVDRALHELSVPTEQVRMLDVGASYQTSVLSRLWHGMRIDTLGFADPRFPPPGDGRHHEFDLNESDRSSAWPALVPYHLLVMAEVIEHLHVSPVHVLRFLSSVTLPGGCLVLTTPNATSLSKRLRVLCGQNPNEMIRENRMDPGHFREYTIAELTTAAATVGFRPVFTWSGHDSSTGSWQSVLYRSICRLLPASLRKSIALVLQKS